MNARAERESHAAMASGNTIHIKDMAVAIADGTMPGEFDDKRTVYTFPTVISRNSRGVPLLWTMQVRLLKGGAPVAITDKVLRSPVVQLPAGHMGEITSMSKQEDGKEKNAAPTYVSEGKNIGKVNETNAITQALRNALGLYNKQLKRAAPAEDGTQPARVVKAPLGGDTTAPVKCLGVIGLPNVEAHPRPMLVKRIGATKDATLLDEDFDEGRITLQRKYNGVRTVAYLACAPARGGEDAEEGAPEILKEASAVLNDIAEEIKYTQEDVLGGGEEPGATVVLYSRTGDVYAGHKQIRAQVLPLLLAAPPITSKNAAKFGIPLKYVKSAEERKAARESWAYSGPFGPPIVYLDGEIYLHGKPLNWISGQARKELDDGKLELHVYDCFFPLAIALGHDMPSEHRQNYLDAIFANKNAKSAHIMRVENFVPESHEEMDKMCKGFLAEGYEGGIARKNWTGYRYSANNYHSSNLVKIKPIYDDEFTVVGFTQGRRGKDVGALIWICDVDEKHVKDPNDKTFSVVPKDMTYEQRKSLFKCLGRKVPDPADKKKSITIFERDLKGLPLTVEFPERTKTGKPSQAKALAFRTYEGGPENDPVRKVLKECGDLEE